MLVRWTDCAGGNWNSTLETAGRGYLLAAASGVRTSFEIQSLRCHSRSRRNYIRRYHDLDTPTVEHHVTLNERPPCVTQHAHFGEEGVSVDGDPRALRPISVLRSWISEGLTQAES